MASTSRSASPASQDPSELFDDTAIDVVVKVKTPRQRCARCVRKALTCRADTTAPSGGKFCQNCTTAGVLCFFHDSEDPLLSTPLVDETSTDSYKALATLHVDLLDNHHYNGELHEDAKRLDALQRASSTGDKTAKKANAREAVNYDLDVSWLYDLFGQTSRFVSAVKTFLEISAAAKKGADIERAKAARRDIVRRIKQLKFCFEEDEDAPEYVPQSPSAMDVEPAATEVTPASAKVKKYKFKIDPDTAELMLACYTRYLKLFNLLASGIERVLKQHGQDSMVKFRGDEHEFRDEYASDNEEPAETQASGHGKSKKGKYKKAYEKGKNKAADSKKLQIASVEVVIGIMVDRQEKVRDALDQAVEALEKEVQGVKAILDMDDKARERWRRLAKKLV